MYTAAGRVRCQSWSRTRLPYGYLSEVVDWKPPEGAKIFELQPLAKDQIAAFLYQQVGSTDGEISGAANLRRRIDLFLLSTFEGHGEESEGGDMRRILSNPMDLTVVAEILTRGEVPDVLNLQQQQHKSMAEHFLHAGSRQSAPHTSLERQPFPRCLLHACRHAAYQGGAASARTAYQLCGRH